MKKLVKVVAIVCAMSMMSTTAFAAGSASGGRNSSSSHLVSGGGSSVSTTTVTATGATTAGTTTTQVLANGQTVTVSGAQVSNGTLTAGLVSNGSGSTAAVGEAKRAGLIPAVVAVLDAIDAGNLASVPAATAGKTVLATTVAITKVTPGSQQQLVMAKSKIPASGVVQVLFYNNTNGTFTVLPATVDAATGIVTFTAPQDGTAAIIG